MEGTLQKGIDPHGWMPSSNGLDETATEAEGDPCLTSFSRPVLT